jgi:hypothetical protein
MRRCILLSATALAVACGSRSDGSVATSSQALIASQCSFFAQNGKTNICHYTGAAKKPYNLLNIDIGNCDFHAANHPNDFVSTTGDCSSPGCLPDLAPFDESGSVSFIGGLWLPRQPCCSHIVAFGVCQPLQPDKCTFIHPDGTPTHLTCPPVSDPSCYTRACNVGTGVCETALIGGRGCGDECSTDADCIATIDGVPDPCQIPLCVLSGTVHLCTYSAPICDDGNACAHHDCQIGRGCISFPISGCTP